MLLDRLLPALQSKGHRVLVFSQMTQMLDLLHDYCHYRNYRFCRFDGATSQVDRQEQVTRVFHVRIVFTVYFLGL